jgi:hypothetical protein
MLLGLIQRVSQYTVSITGLQGPRGSSAPLALLLGADRLTPLALYIALLAKKTDSLLIQMEILPQLSLVGGGPGHHYRMRKIQIRSEG